MKILVHDYVGHPFQVQLSRALAARDHIVRHLFSASFQSPRGALERRDGDPAGFEVGGITIGEAISKYSYLKRFRQERRYAALLSKEIERFDPDVVISSNTPLDVQAVLIRQCRTRQRRFIYWLQDLYGEAVGRVLRRRIPVFWRVVAARYRRLEQGLLASSDAIVMITEDFQRAIDWKRTRREVVHVIENWAPLDELPPRPKDNPWSRRYGLADRPCVLYSGTLGLKHNPDLLFRLAWELRAGDSNAVVVVVSEGAGAEWLKARKAEVKLDNLLILDYQPFADMPDVLASADVLTAILEPDAGVYSVPSKVLTYLCAGRPLVLAVPGENLSAKIVKGADAGTVVDPRDASAFANACIELLRDPVERDRLGRNARAYAEKTFDIQSITDAFERIILA